MSDKKPKRNRFAVRPNVLILMGGAYVILFLMFCILVWGADKVSAEDAWNMLQAPLLALIGGSIAISKDLIADEESVPNKQLDNLEEPDPEPEN